MQLVFSLYKGPKYYVRSLFAERANEVETWDYIMCFASIVFNHIYRPSVISKLTDTELIFPATLKPENNDWSFTISVLVQNIFLIKLTLYLKLLFNSFMAEEYQS